MHYPKENMKDMKHQNNSFRWEGSHVDHQIIRKCSCDSSIMQDLNPHSISVSTQEIPSNQENPVPHPKVLDSNSPNLGKES